MSLYKQVEQKSEEWLQLRCGRITASSAWKLLDVNSKGTYSSQYTNFLWDLVIERMSGTKIEIYQTPAMKRGIALEPVALEFYCDLHGVEVEEHGFELHPKYDFIGASPDGLVKGTKKLVEIKNPMERGFLNVKYTNEPDFMYVVQCQLQMEVMGYDFCDLFYYNNTFKPEDSFQQFSLKRDPVLIDKILAAAVEMDQKANNLINEVKLRKAINNDYL